MNKAGQAFPKPSSWTNPHPSPPRLNPVNRIVSIRTHVNCAISPHKRAALNQFNQSHEVKNLFVVDGSSFTTASEKNPTLTILALAMRSTDFLADQMKKGEL